MKQQYLPALLIVFLASAASGKTVPTNATADLVLGKNDFVTSSVALPRSLRRTPKFGPEAKL